MFQAFSLHVIITCRSDERGEMLLRYAIDATGVEQTCGPQRRDRLLNVNPGGILGQDGADDDLEPGTGRPPALWSKISEQMPVEGEEPTSGCCLWHVHYCDWFF